MLQKAKPNRKSQSALEYMMTYGWAILIIVIVAGVLYSLGIFSPSSSTGTTITGFSDFGVNGQCIQGGALQLQITNGIGYPINVTRINTTGSNGQSVTINTSVLILPSQSQLVFIPGACPASAGSSYSNPVTFTYKEPGQTLSGPYLSKGTILGRSSTERQQQVASFNPNLHSYVLVHSSSSLNITGSMTVVAWYYLVGAIGNYIEGLVWKCEALFPGGNGPAGGYNLALGYGTGYDFEDGPQNSSGWTSGASGSDTGRWIQLVGIKAGGTNTLQLYFNGVANGPNSAATWPLTDSVENLTIGASENPSLSYFFNGSISNVQIYNTALSNAQVQQLYSEGLSGAPLPNAGLVAWWPLDGNANDYSGNNNNGVATNVSWVSP
jgi:hypothetical protein